MAISLTVFGDVSLRNAWQLWSRLSLLCSESFYSTDLSKLQSPSVLQRLPFNIVLLAEMLWTKRDAF